MDTGVYALLLPYLRLLIPQALERAGCDDPALRGLAEEARKSVDSHPVLREHALPLGDVPA